MSSNNILETGKHFTSSHPTLVLMEVELTLKMVPLNSHPRYQRRHSRYQSGQIEG